MVSKITIVDVRLMMFIMEIYRRELRRLFMNLYCIVLLTKLCMLRAALQLEENYSRKHGVLIMFVVRYFTYQGRHNAMSYTSE